MYLENSGQRIPENPTAASELRRGGKCSVWEGGARATALVYAPGRAPQGQLRAASFSPSCLFREFWSIVLEGFVFPGLFHASDWLPTIMEGLVGVEVKASDQSRKPQSVVQITACQGTKPLDGLNLWPALVHNASSARSDIFYGIAVAWTNLDYLGLHPTMRKYV